MQVASSTLYGPVSLTVVEAGQGDDAWVFFPFEDQTATVNVFEDRYLFAYSHKKDWALFDLEERRRVAKSIDRWALPHIFCFSQKHRAFFFAGQHPPGSRYNRVHEVPVCDGSLRTHELAADAHVAKLAARADGAIIGLTQMYEEGTLRWVLHPQSGKVQIDRLPDAPYFAPLSDYGPRWISPDARWALRNALGAPHRVSAQRGSLLDRFMPRRHAFEHPDLRRDGEPRYALALELIELEPLRHADTLVVAYQTPRELNLYPNDVKALDAWFRRPTAERPMLLPRSYVDSLDPEQAEIERLAETRILNHLGDVIWDADSNGFSIRVGHYQVLFDSNNSGFYRQSRRHVGLDGSVGDLEIVESKRLHPELPELTERAYEVARATIKSRSTQVISLSGTHAVDLQGAIKEMARRITENLLSEITFAGVLRFRFRFGRKLLNEKKLFELVRAIPFEETQPLIEALRDLLLSYNEATRRHTAGCLRSSEDDDAPAALSEAALSLATLDSESDAALRGWFQTVDQEHDSFAAEKVFPAYAERTGFRDVSAVRFGVWFFLYQWQTVSFGETWLGLFKVVQNTVAPEVFARLAEDEARLFSDSSVASNEAGHLMDNVERVIEQIEFSSWGKTAADHLRRLASAQ